MKLQVASLSDRGLWDSFHAKSRIPSHAHSLAAAFAFSGIQPQLACVTTLEGGMVLPFFERHWQGTVDICTWLSVSGAKLWGDPRPALDIWSQYATGRGWVAGYIQVEPDSAVQDVPSLMQGNSVLMMDLNADHVFAATSKTILHGIRRADARGVRLEERRSLLADAFVHLYPLAMARLGSSAAYLLSAETLRALVLSPDTLVLGAAVGGDLHSVSLFPVSHGNAENFLAAGTEEGRELSRWLYMQLIRRCQEAGIRRLNLGGGVHSGDGIFQFKARFGGTPRPLGVIRQIYDPKTYGELCAKAGLFPSQDNRWFPAYRASRTVVV